MKNIDVHVEKMQSEVYILQEFVKGGGDKIGTSGLENEILRYSYFNIFFLNGFNNIRAVYSVFALY